MMRLSAKLYGQPQSEKESTELFLEQRHLLARRLLPVATEEQIVAVLLESLRGSIKKLLRGATIENVEDLISKATQIERDELEDRHSNRRAASANQSQSDSAASPKNQAGQNNQKRELPQCYFCPERHWNRDCPRHPNRLGNGQGASNSAATTVPRTTAQ